MKRLLRNRTKLVWFCVVLSFLLVQPVKSSLAAYVEPKTFGLPPFQITLLVCTDPRAIFDPENIFGFSGGTPSSFGFYCLGGIAYQAFSSVAVLLGIAFFAMLLVGGFKYLTAGGDEKAIDSAKKTLTFAVSGLLIGLASVFLSAILIQILNPSHEITMPDGRVIRKVVDPLRFLIPDYFCTEYGRERATRFEGRLDLDWLCGKK